MPRTVDREMARSWTEGFERWLLVRRSVEEQKGAPKPEGKDGLLAFKRKRGLSCN